MDGSDRISVDEVRGLLDCRDFKSLRRLLKEREEADVAELFEQLDLPEQVVLYRLVPRSRRSAMFAHLSSDLQQELIDELPDIIVVNLLNDMEPDDRTKLLEEFDPSARNKLLLQLDPKERRVAWQLLSYPEHSVGRLMTPDFLALDASMRVGQALNLVHWNTSLPVEYLNHLFVIDDAGQLTGEVSLASLVVCDPPTKKVVEVMQKANVFLRPEMEESEAIEIFRKYDRLYIPVVDSERTILGIVSADDIFDIAEEEATEDIQQFGGQDALDDTYLGTPFIVMLKKRAGWLAFLFVSGFVSGHAIRSFEDSLSKWAFLMFFLPIITSAGGNSGTQVASLIIRSLAIRELRSADVFKVLRRELILGLTLGVILASIGYGFAQIWGLGPKVGSVVFLSVVCVVVFGVVAGSMLPFVFRWLKLDPAVVSSPFISTIVDVTGILILFNIAMLLFSLG